jgi:uncharacterized protein
VPSGESALLHFPIAELPDGTKVSLPLIVLSGSEDGPTLWLDALIHGSEMPGYEVIRRITREVVNSDGLRGAVVAAPILNPLAFHASQMHTPQDGYNLNRLFPGDSGGFLGQRMAHRILTDLISHVNYVVDLHANPEPALMFSLTLPGDGDEFSASRLMAEHVGVTTVEMRSVNEGLRRGTLTEAALAAGKPAIAIELVGWRRMDEAPVRAGVRGVLNVMKGLGMIGGTIEPQSDVVVISGLLTRIELTSAGGGLVEFRKSVGDVVSAGETIAVLRNGFGDITEEIKTPVNGNLLAYPLVANQAASTGEIVAFICLPA